jgi:hypothetical protein
MHFANWRPNRTTGLKLPGSEPLKAVEKLDLAIQQVADRQRILVVAPCALFDVGPILEKPILLPPP